MRAAQGSCLFIAFLLSMTAFAAGPERPITGERRPFHVRYFDLDEPKDFVKPLASASYAGWVSASGLIIGAVNGADVNSDRWVGAFSVEDATPKWWLKAPGDLTAPPVVFGNWVVLGFRDGTIKKVETQTGKEIWSRTLESFPSRQIALAGSSLLVITASQHLHSLDFGSGESNWLFDGGHPDGLAVRSMSGPVVYDSRVYFGVHSGEIVCVTLDAGKLEWRHDPKYSEARFHDVVGEIVIKDKRLVFARYDGLVGAFSLTDSNRALIWHHQLPSVATSVFRGGKLFVGSANGDVSAIQVTNGTIHWRRSTGRPVGEISAGERAVYVSGAQGRISALDSFQGDYIWHDDLGAMTVSKAIYVGKDIYFGTGNNNLYGYSIHPGR